MSEWSASDPSGMAGDDEVFLSSDEENEVPERENAPYVNTGATLSAMARELGILRSCLLREVGGKMSLPAACWKEALMR